MGEHNYRIDKIVLPYLLLCTMQWRLHRGWSRRTPPSPILVDFSVLTLFVKINASTLLAPLGGPDPPPLHAEVMRAPVKCLDKTSIWSL